MKISYECIFNPIDTLCSSLTIFARSIFAYPVREGQDIEAARVVSQSRVGLQVVRCGESYSTLFRRSHRGGGTTKLPILAVTNLNKYEGAGFGHDKINLAKAAGVILAD